MILSQEPLAQGTQHAEAEEREQEDPSIKTLNLTLNPNPGIPNATHGASAPGKGFDPDDPSRRNGGRRWGERGFVTRQTHPDRS
jgi:hypothetical protein